MSHDYSDNSCPDNHIAHCISESARNCTSLKEVLVDSYRADEGLRLDDDTPYHIFSVFDLFYSGLISGHGAPPKHSRDVVLESAAGKIISEKRCNNLLDHVNLSTKDTAECQWSYTCKYNPNYFPSFTVQAELDYSSEEKKCSQININNVKFVRTTCEANPEADHWCKCDAGYIPIGYKHQS